MSISDEITQKIIEDIDYEYTELMTELPVKNNYSSIDKTLLESYVGILPNALLYFWQKYQLNSYGNGLWWHTNPEEYTSTVESWLNGTEFWDPEENPYYVIGRTAFGEMYLWGKKTGRNLILDPRSGTIYL